MDDGGARRGPLGDAGRGHDPRPPGADIYISRNSYTISTQYLQLWVNLAAAHKMVEPSYQELPASRVPEAEAGGARVRVIAGSSLGVTSPVLTRWRL